MHAASVAAEGNRVIADQATGRGEARAHDTGLELHFGHVPVEFCPVWTFQMTGTCPKTFRQAAYAARIRLAARFSALMTPRSDARTMDSLIPTPQ